MPKLTVRRGDTLSAHVFSGQPTLAQVLAVNGFAMGQPCGGRGVCGKCAVTALTGDVSAPNAAERRAGARLACQARLTGDCAVTLPDARAWAGIESSDAAVALGVPMPGRYGAAVDLGTTTLVARVFDLQSGQPLGEHALLNPQTAVAADVMGRVSAALAGSTTKLHALARDAVRSAVAGACKEAGVPGVDALTIAGNTVMLYLLTGRDPVSLSRAPFAADFLFGVEEELAGATMYLPPCAGAFMGADLTCAALSTQLCDQAESVMLADIGTNGELMLWHRGKLYAASAPAGPAFEGGEISQGCGSVTGAIDRVWVENGALGARVIGGGKAVGVCGSGLMDAVAALLALGRIDASGAADAPSFLLAEGVRLTAGDIRAVQLAKAAVAAGIDTLLATAEAQPADVKTLQLAGGCGSRLSTASAVAIGLSPAALAGRTRAVGNAALSGACMLLLDTRLRRKAEQIAHQAQIVPLGGSEVFVEHFLADMAFPVGEEA